MEHQQHSKHARLTIYAVPRPATGPRAIKRESNQEEVRLICKVLEGRKDLFDDLLQPHLTALFRFVRAKMRHDPEADDVIQSTMLKAYLRLEQFRLEASFRTWLMAIAVNEILQWRRKRVGSRLLTVRPMTLSQLPIADQGASPLRECQRLELAAMLHRALGKLPEKYQLVIRLRDLQDLSFSETAAVLRLSIATVKTRHRRARLQMIRFLRCSAEHI